MLESDFQSHLIARLREMFPGCMVLKQDTSYLQGIPDLLILYKDRWAALEVKRSIRDMKRPQPNQKYYVSRMDDMSFASFICPEIEEDVLYALQQAF